MQLATKLIWNQKGLMILKFSFKHHLILLIMLTNFCSALADVDCLLLLLTFVVFLRFKSLIVQFASE